jgi:hypothetical protein
MRARSLLLLLGALAAVNLGCAAAPKARAEQVRKTPDGGTLLVTQGDDYREANRAALKAMEIHCKGDYAVVEISKSGTGTFTSQGEAYSAYGATVASSVHSTVFGIAITYVCRKPGPKDLNQSVVAEAALGLKCSSPEDCGGAPCILPIPDYPDRLCARFDGTLPYAVKGQDCSQRPCMPGLKCSWNAAEQYCR